jgi:hypothetical protein
VILRKEVFLRAFHPEAPGMIQPSLKRKAGIAVNITAPFRCKKYKAIDGSGSNAMPLYLYTYIPGKQTQNIASLLSRTDLLFCPPLYLYTFIPIYRPFPIFITPIKPLPCLPVKKI